MKIGNVPATLAAAALTFSFGLSALANSLHGNIQLGNAGGERVNGDCFSNCCDVYLNAALKSHGHQHDNDDWNDDDDENDGQGEHCSHGFRDGDYYFQVTDACGNTLLSSDDIEQRRITIQNGAIVQYLGSSGACVHEIGTAIANDCNPAALSVQLMPFNPTENESGIYKAWITPVCDYKPDDQCSVFGFRHHRSRTDNFRCQPPVSQPPDPQPEPTCTVVINQYYDANSSGGNDGELPLDGVRYSVMCQPPGGGEVTQTMVSGAQALGQVALDVPPGSLVMVEQVLPIATQSNSHWMQTEPNAGCTDAMLVNGQWCYEFTTPQTTDSVYTLEFGNASLYAPHGGRASKYWATNPGKAVLERHEMEWRNKMDANPLRNPNGKPYNVPEGDFDAAHADFAQWLRNTGSNNMACQLSIQLASVRLTSLYAHLNLNARVLVSDNAAANLGMPGNVLSIRKAMNLATQTLGQHRLTIAPSTVRTYQRQLMATLKSINTNRLWFVRRQAPAVTY